MDDEEIPQTERTPATEARQALDAATFGLGERELLMLTRIAERLAKGEPCPPTSDA